MNRTIFERMVDDLHGRELSDSEIEELRKKWAAAPANRPAPCPLCMLDGATGTLEALPEDEQGVERLQCGACHEEIQLSPG